MRRSLFALLVIFFSCATIGLLGPRFVSNINAAYPLSMKQKLVSKENYISPHSLIILIDETKKSVKWSGNSDYWQLLASLYLYQAQFQIESSQNLNQIELIEKAQDLIIRGLFFSPVDPYGWFNLARIDTVLHNEKVAVLRSLLFSIRTGVYEPGLLVPRFMMLLESKDSFQKYFETLLLSQFILIMKFNGEELASIVSRDVKKYIFMQQSILSSSYSWKTFKTYFEKHYKQNQK